jgi:hypothetical protein
MIGARKMATMIGEFSIALKGRCSGCPVVHGRQGHLGQTDDVPGESATE